MRNMDGFTTIQDLMREDPAMAETTKGTSKWMAVKWSFLYLIWSHRNKLVFKREKSHVIDLFFEFQRKTFEWVNKRAKKSTLDWAGWLSNPSG